MAIYKGGDLDNLIDLINENNPDLPWPLDKVNFIYGKPAPIVGATDAQPNTTVRVQAKFNSTYRGSIDVAYRRVNLATLFRGIPIIIYRWWSGYIYMRDLLPLINEKYGLNLANDFGNGNSYHISESGAKKALSQNDNNYFYTGSVQVQVFLDKEELGLDILRVVDINRVAWPGGNDFTRDRRGQGEFLLTHVDFTENATLTVGTENNWTGTSLATALNITVPQMFSVTEATTNNIFYEKSPERLDSTAEKLAAYNLMRTQPSPSLDVPGASSRNGTLKEGYNRVKLFSRVNQDYTLLLNNEEKTPVVGVLYVHFNV